MQSLLFLSHRAPYPPDRGEKIRAWNILQHLAGRYRVHLGFLVDDPLDWPHLPFLRSLCADVGAFGIDKRWQKVMALARFRPGRPLMLDYYRHDGLRAWVRATLARTAVDCAYIYSTAMAPYVLDAPSGLHAPQRLLDMVDVDSEKWSDYARRTRLPMRAVWAREGRTLLAYERRAAAACARTMLVSAEEAARFGTLAPELAGRIDWLENGVDLDRFSPEHAFDDPYPDAASRVVFTGNMDYWPNADAAIWFARDILPLLRLRHPAVQFVVVGAQPGAEVRALAELPGVQVTGRVADVRPYVAHAVAVVAPLRIARGIQNKVLEGMAMGRPVIASPQAFEGVRAVPGRDLLVGDDAAGLAACVAEVLNGGHRGLGAAGRVAVEHGYAWAATLARLDRIMADMAGDTPITCDGRRGNSA